MFKGKRVELLKVDDPLKLVKRGGMTPTLTDMHNKLDGTLTSLRKFLLMAFFASGLFITNKAIPARKQFIITLKVFHCNSS